MNRLSAIWDELTEWSELIFWGAIGGALLLSIVATVGCLAWHVFWWMLLGAV